MKDQAIAPAKSLLDHRLSVDTLPDEGRIIEIDATQEEREAIAQELDLLSLERLVAELEVRPKAKGRVQVKGRLRAALTQACVVSLEPVPSEISDVIEAEFWPEEQIAARAKSALDEEGALDLEPLAADGPDPIDNGNVNLGQLVFETLATLIDPFPRKDGAAFTWSSGDDSENDAGGPAKENPFAVLEKLKSEDPKKT